MNAKQAAQFQKMLEDACDRFIASGGKIISGIFNGDTKQQCPIACLVGTDNGQYHEKVAELTRETMNYDMSYHEVWTFVYAYDNSPLADFHKPYVSAMLIGRSLREKYITQKA